MLSDLLPGFIKAAERIGRIPSLPSGEILKLLEKSGKSDGLDAEECAALINGTLDRNNRMLVLDFAARAKRPRDSKILLLPPLYFASHCENTCLYCDFNDEGTRLTPGEFTGEFQALLDLGYRSIELVSSQDPELYFKSRDFALENQRFDIDAALEYFRTARRLLDAAGGGMLTSNIPPLDRASLGKLKSAGLDCFLLWVETFSPRQYVRLHAKNSPKANQAFRLDVFEQALESGIEHIAGAFLKGLYDWRKEEAVLYLFDRHLRKNRSKGFSIIGTPRLKGAFTASALVKDYFVSDEDYELNIALDRILFDGLLWLQTRETPGLNRRLLKRFGGGVIMTLDCSTAPGGYKSPSKSKAQFPVYRQDLSQAVTALEDEGFEVIFDWNGRTLSDCLKK